MLTREDLETWKVPGPDNMERFPEIQALRDAAPKLALACLSLRDYALGVYDGDFPRAAETAKAIAVIDAALAAAGVEVP